MSLRRVHLLQCPAPSSHINAAKKGHWHAQEVIFALLKEFITYVTDQPLLEVVRHNICVFDSQVVQQPGKD